VLAVYKPSSGVVAAQRPTSTGIIVSFGQVIVGGVTSTIVTVKEQVEVLLLPSTAVYVMV